MYSTAIKETLSLSDNPIQNNLTPLSYYEELVKEGKLQKNETQVDTLRNITKLYYKVLDYLKNPDAAAMHERHKEFLAIFQNEDPDGKAYGAKN